MGIIFRFLRDISLNPRNFVIFMQKSNLVEIRQVM